MTRHDAFQRRPGTPGRNPDPFGMESFVEEEHRPDPFGRLTVARNDPIVRMREAFRRGTLFEEGGDKLFRLKGSVGAGERVENGRVDTAKVETALERAGLLDLTRLEGPTGFIDERKTNAIRNFQRDNRLKVDGLIRPGGETIRMLQAKLSPPKRTPLGVSGTQKSSTRSVANELPSRFADASGVRQSPSASPATGVGAGTAQTAQTSTSPQGKASSGSRQLPAINVPAYRRDVFLNQPNAWKNWSQSVRKLPKLSSAEERAYMEIFAAEGGTLPDPRGTASSGITQRTLNELINKGKVRGIRPNTPPNNLPLDKRVQFYRAYFDDAMSGVRGGAAALARIGNDEAAAAFADTLFRHGRKGGSTLIQKAINAVSPNAVRVDGAVGANTFAEFKRLVTAGSGSRETLFDALANERKKSVSGESARFDHFRFQKSP